MQDEQTSSRLEEVLLTALDLPEEQWPAYLSSACCQNSTMQAAVESLLRHSDPLRTTMLRQAMGLTLLTTLAEVLPIDMERYRLEARIGEGAFGVVYRGQQLAPVKREVAVKVLRPGLNSAEILRRFESERQTLARLDHTNIARLFDAGNMPDGRPFFVMELLQGKPLTGFCDEHRLNLRQRLSLFIDVCTAVEHAHRRGIVHRDLKPSNILVVEQDPGAPGLVKVIDFGIARALSDGVIGQGTLTMEGGRPVGTPQYMSPEQVDGDPRKIDQRSDIYTLGVILHELLTGTTPVKLDELRNCGLEQMRRLITAREPSAPSSRLTGVASDASSHIAQRRGTSPSRLLRSVRGDLDWVVVKSLEHDLARRYETASELAADVRRYLNGEPVLARQPGRVYRFEKLVRRHKLAFAAVLTVTVTLIVGIVTSTWQAVRATRAEKSAVAAQRGEAQMRRVSDQRGQQLLRQLYVARMNLAGEAALDPGGMDHVRQLLEPWKKTEPDLRGWEWYYLEAVSHRERLTIQAHTESGRRVAWSPDGLRVASIAEDNTLKIWNAANGELVWSIPAPRDSYCGVAWSPDSTRVLVGCSDSSAQIWEVATGQQLHVLTAHTNAVYGVAWSPDGTRVATGSYDLHIIIWDPITGKQLRTLSGHKDKILSLAWSPDGTELLSGGNDGIMKIWDLESGRERLNLTRNMGRLLTVAWSPDGAKIAGVGDANFLFVWDARTGNLLHDTAKHQGTIAGLAWSPDSARLATTGRTDFIIKVWDGKNGKQLAAFGGHQGSVESVAWSPGGASLATTGEDGTVKFWDLARPEPVLSLRGHTDRIMSVSWHPDCTRIASACRDNTVRIWDASSGQTLQILTAHTAQVMSAGWDRTGTRFASSGYDRTVRFWDLQNNSELTGIPSGEARNFLSAWSPDGTRIATCGSDRVLRVYDAASLREIASCPSNTGNDFALAWNPTGTRVATSGTGRTVVLWDASTSAKVASFETHSNLTNGVAFSPDGNRLASCGTDGVVHVFDVTTTRELMRLSGHTGSVWAVAWSPDGKRIASGGFDSLVKIWDADSGEEVLCLRDLKKMVVTVAWSPDGKRLACAGGDQVIMIFDYTRAEKGTQAESITLRSAASAGEVAARH